MPEVESHDFDLSLGQNTIFGSLGSSEGALYDGSDLITKNGAGNSRQNGSN